MLILINHSIYKQILNLYTLKFLLMIICYNSCLRCVGGEINRNTTHVKDKLVNALAELFDKENSEATQMTLRQLPLSVLFQINPKDPKSLIICPEGTMPFDLETCTSGIVAVAGFKGSCSDVNAVYDEKNAQCWILTETEAFLTCPKGYRFTLLPTNPIKGSCVHSEVIPAIPRCDPPYILSPDHAHCVLRQATLGTVGCHPGELGKGTMCIAARQVARDIKCPQNFVPEITPLGEQCVNKTTVPGIWNIFTQKAVCPTGYRADINRVLKKQKAKISEKPKRSSKSSSWKQKSGYHEPLQASPQNISCIKISKKPPLTVNCPPDAMDYTTFIQNVEDTPVVPSFALPLDPLLSCVKLKTYSLVPTCRSPKEKIYLDGTDHILEFLKKSSRWNNTTKTNNSFLKFNSFTSEGTRHLNINRRRAASLKSWWPFQPNDVELLPTNFIIHSVGNQTKHNKSEVAKESRLYPSLNRSSASSFLTSVDNNPPASFGDPLIVDWSKLHSLNDTLETLQRFNFTIEDIDWKLLHDRNLFRIICETKTSASFYLVCPEKFKLRKDGMCAGLGHSNFLLLCPKGYILDDFLLVQSPANHPKPRCVGNTTAYTTIECLEYGGNAKSIGLPKQNCLSANSRSNSLPNIDETFFTNSTNLQFNTNASRLQKTQYSETMSKYNKSEFNHTYHDINKTLERLDLLSLSANNSSTGRFTNSLFPNEQHNTLTEEFKHVEEKLCYRVSKRVNATFTPSYTIVKNLYGVDTANTFFHDALYAERFKTSPFFKTLYALFK